MTFSITLAIRWAARQVERRFRHADALVNDGQIPAEWLEPFRAEVERLCTAGAAETDIQHVADRAQTVCLRNIDTLIGFFENSPFVDNAGTRALLLDELRQQRQHWTAAEWVTLVRG